jgi:uncharacterized membrane protein YdjX (TVP38/TMEM64 family)
MPYLPAFLKNRSTRRKLAIALMAIAAIAGIRVFGAGRYVTFENVKRNRDYLRGLVSGSYLLFVAGYIFAYVLVASLAVPFVAEPLSLAGGLMFGTLPSAIYINIGATTGASIAFLLSRHLFRGWVQQTFQAQLVSFNREVERNGARYLLSLRLMPLVSFVLVDVLSGLTKIPLKTFVWTTSIGILPASLIYSYAGSRIRYIQSPGDIFSPRVLTALGILALMPILSMIYRKIMGEKLPSK